MKPLNFCIEFFKIFFCSAFFINASYAQEIVSYKTKTKFFYTYGKETYQQLTPVDRLNIKPYEEIDSVVVNVSIDGFLRKTIYHLSSNKFPDWISRPYKTVITSSDVTAYNKDGEIVANYNISADNTTDIKGDYSKSEDVILAKAIKENGYKNYPPFTQISDAEMQEMRNNNIEVKKYDNGVIHIRKGEEELIYDAENMQLDKRTISDKILHYSMFSKFKKSESGAIIPEYNLEKNLTKSQKNMNMWFIREIKTTEFKRTKLNQLNIPIADNGSEYNIEIFPNPASNELKMITPMELVNSNLAYYALDIAGKNILEGMIRNQQTSIDISRLSNGVYLLVVSTKSGNFQNNKIY